MLRSLVPDEPELLRLCMCKNWCAVSIRCRSHPFEARPSELAIRGKSTTALGIAVRSGAPRDTVQLLVDADFQQAGIHHCRRGNILMEALKHRSSDEVLDYLLRAIVHYRSIYPQRPDIMDVKDDLGRTALHYMVERMKFCMESGQTNPNNLCLFRNVLLARPESSRVLDSDGNTPLILLLLSPRVDYSHGSAVVEVELYHMVQLILSVCPEAAAIERTLPEPWHEMRTLKVDVKNERNNYPGNGCPTPLFYAVLYGRSDNTVRALLDANRKVGKSSSTFVTQYHEVPLHIAITAQASLPVITMLLQDCNEAVLCSDVYGLTPVDWMWIRHVVSWYTGAAHTRSSIISRSRHIAGHFLEWHENVSRWITADTIPGLSRPFKKVTEDLLDNMKLLLPAYSAAGNPGTTIESWSLLHAACYVPCPAAILQLALEQSGPELLQTLDSHSHRTPLHYLTCRLGTYTARIPVGFSRNVKRVTEKSTVPILVSRFQGSCAIPDKYGQLPLHIAIDAARQCREKSALASHRPTHAAMSASEIDGLEDETLFALLSGFPSAIETYDGKSRLLPFQQAAIGRGARLTTIFVLLRRLPSLLISCSSKDTCLPGQMET